MDGDRRAPGDPAPRGAKPRSHFFTVRLWKEDVAGGSEYRGTVREVISGAYRGFRDWSDLTSFLMARVEEDNRGRGA
jgi:hypothetical protein